MKTNSIKNNKKTISSISLILILAVSMIIAFTQPTLAQVGIPQPEKTVGYVSVAPTLIGVGQTATVNLWIYPLPTTYDYRPYFKGFDGITVTFVKPDGTKDSFMPVDGTGQYVAGQTQSLGALYFYYKPDTPGNWSVTFTMPAQNITDKSGTVQYSACISNTASFTVQTDHVNAGLLDGYPWSPLPNPNVYWNYPINANNREWNQISGDWTGTTTTAAAVNSATCLRWQPYGSGPNTAHIVWTQPLTAGGIIGGDYSSYSYAVRIREFVIMEGKAFVNIPNAGQFECIDLTTGKVIYQKNGSVSYGIHYPGDAHAQSNLDPSVLLASSFGSNYVSYLYGTSGSTWNYYDPFTGALMRSIVNCSAARLIDGSNLAYGTRSDTFFAWNISKVVNNNWPTGIEWARPLPVSSNYRTPSLFAVSADASTIVLSNYNQYWGYSAKDGTQLWNFTLTYPVATNEEIPLYPVDGFIIFDPVAATWHCYSMKTGAQLWESPSFANSPWATTWTVYNSETNDDKNLYLMFPDGIMRALSLETGKLVWESKPFPSTEYTNNVVPYVMAGTVMVGGNIYCYAGYSIGYQINPVPRFGMLVCVNATTGEVSWTLNGGVAPIAAANGYVIGWGIYDGNLYCLGKGQTSTTVTASPKVGSAGSNIFVEGTVMDQSPASLNTPAVSDESMTESMDYLHMQNATLLNNAPKPNGVTVRLAAVNPNGDVIDLGTVTSDSGGMFKKTWIPPAEGEYTVYATFDGSNSYFGSYAETGLSISKASTETSTSQQQTTPDYTMTIIYAAIAIIIAVIISIAIVGMLILRKK